MGIRSNVRQLKSLWNDWLALMNRMEAERFAYEAESAKHNQQFRERMGAIRAVMNRIENDSSVRAVKAAHELKLLEAEKIRLLQLLAERECNH